MRTTPLSRKKALRISLASSVFLSLSATSSQAAVASLDADTYVDQRNSDMRYGGADTIQVKNGAENNSRTGYIRFDLSSTANGNAVTNATLSLTVENEDGVDDNGNSRIPAGVSLRVWGLTDGSDIEGFDESTLTWDNSGGNERFSENSSSASLLAEQNLSYGPERGDRYSFDVTSFVQANTGNMDGTNFASFGLTYGGTPTNVSTEFFTKENMSTGAAPASLSVVPEPTNAAIGLLLAGGFLSHRSRRFRRS